MVDLPDVNVWLSLRVPDHPHHPRASHYWYTEAAQERAINRITWLALLRLLTDARMFGDAALDAASARRVIGSWSNMPRVSFASEPPGLTDLLQHWGMMLDIRGADWTDAYVAAFATAAGCRLVSFDAEFERYPGLSWLHLEP